MANPLLIAFPDIPAEAIKINTQVEYSDFRPVYNLFKGARSHHAQHEIAQVISGEIDFKLADGNEKSASYLLIARADMLLAQGVTEVHLQRSTDYSVWTTVDSETLATNLFIGPKSQDLLLTFTETSAYRYWRVYFVCTVNSYLRFSKLYLGNMYDFGVAPDMFSYTIQEDDVSQPFEADSGSIHLDQTTEAKRVITIKLDGMTDAKADDLMNSALVNKQNQKGIFLYTQEQHQILNNDILLHCEVLDIQKDDLHGWPNWNTITLTVKELLG